MTIDPLAEPARIAFAGDWHAQTPWAVHAIEHAAQRGADVVVHLGDFGYRFRPAYLRALNAMCAGHKLPLLFVEGNHEDHRWLARRPVGEDGLRHLTGWIWHVPRGFRWTWGGVRFLGLGGAHSVDGMWRRQIGELWQREETVTVEQAEQVAAGGPADVMVMHDCPAGVDIPGLLPPGTFPEIEIMRADEHRTLLRGVVDQVQPRAIWHGHYHSRYTATPDLGYGPVQVTGLDCDGTTLAANVEVVDLADLAQLVQVGV